MAKVTFEGIIQEITNRKSGTSKSGSTYESANLHLRTDDDKIVVIEIANAALGQLADDDIGKYGGFDCSVESYVWNDKRYPANKCLSVSYINA